jgi:hypothetical protein
VGDMKKLFIDIETIPDFSIDEDLRPQAALGALKDPAKIQAKKDEFKETGLVKAMSVDPLQNKVVCIQACLDDKYIDFPLDEKEALEMFWQLLPTLGRDYLIIGHGIIGFDIKTILTRSMIHGLTSTLDLRVKRYSKKPVFDTMEIMADWDKSKWKSLDWLCKRFGCGEKNNDASNVYDLYKTDQFNKIKEYCKNDVLMVKSLFEKIHRYY